MHRTSRYSLMRPFLVFIEVSTVFRLTVLVRRTGLLSIFEWSMLLLRRDGDGKIPVLISSCIVEGNICLVCLRYGYLAILSWDCF